MTCTRVSSAVLAAMLLSSAGAPAQEAGPLTVTENITLQKDAVLTTPLVIAADNVVIDGNGATIQGPGKAGDTKSFVGVGVLAEGRSNVILRNLKVRGFESALVARDGKNWVIEDCDFSDNYHDPDYGWGDYKRVGGLILTDVDNSVIRNNKATGNWNGLDLWESDDNLVEKNDFSHCSNVCLKMWTACRNRVLDNNLSYGLRISPGEVHARDSTSVLMESGSNDNHYERNDITHGGDGVFIRVLNGWVSTGNVFIENDCSYANNNGFEAWSPDNTYIRNKANHCSYGFWLGGSDHTVLIGNEAAYNGQPDGFHNAPESDFVHGGIVIVHGSGTHTLIEGNYCHHNNGAGIVFRGDLGTRGAKWKMYHLIVQNNRLENNRWGIFARFTDWLYLAGNVFKDNEEDEFLEEVTNVARGEADPLNKPAPKVVLDGPQRAMVGEKVTFDASGSTDAADRPLKYRWDIGGKVYTDPKVTHVFNEAGFYRVGVTVDNGHLAGLAFRDVYVTAPTRELATEGNADAWKWTMGGGDGGVTFTNDSDAIVGKQSVQMRVDPYRGADVSAVLPKGTGVDWHLDESKTLSFWLRFRNENNGAFQGPNPIVRLHAGKASYTYMPVYNGMPRNLLGDLPYSEARNGWLQVRMPLAGHDEWTRSETFDGAAPPHVDNGLRFTTVETEVATQDSTSMVSDGKHLYLATLEGGRLLRSDDGVHWKDLKRPRELGGRGGGWMNGMLAYYPAGGDAGRLYLRRRQLERDEHGDEHHCLVYYDIAGDNWVRTSTISPMSHGTVIVGDCLFGIAHAIGPNYGGPICRVDLSQPGAVEQRTALGPVPGKDAWWFSRAAQFAESGGMIYAIKNDWQTPQPEKAEDIGDRLLAFDPAEFKSSSFAGGKLWSDKNWQVAYTAPVDLGPLPFEVGHGACLVSLPPKWCPAIGSKGGLFIVAGNSPSNHEGYGSPSNRYALYDIESGKFTLGVLPNITGSATSAILHGARVFIKRGGVNYAPSNSELWIVEPLAPEDAAATGAAVARERISLEKVDRLSLQFDSWGHAPITLWIDGLKIE